MTGFWICLAKASQGFENASSSKYDRSPNNMQGCEFARATQGADYDAISLDIPYGYIEGFQRFPKSAAEVHEVIFFDMERYIYSECLFNTLDIEIKHKC